jgi:hypothetical protein
MPRGALAGPEPADVPLPLPDTTLATYVVAQA